FFVCLFIIYHIEMETFNTNNLFFRFSSSIESFLPLIITTCIGYIMYYCSFYFPILLSFVCVYFFNLKLYQIRNNKFYMKLQNYVLCSTKKSENIHFGYIILNFPPIENDDIISQYHHYLT